MPQTITNADLRRQVSNTLAGVEDISAEHIDTIVGKVIDKYGLVSLDNVEDDEYWTIVETVLTISY